MGYRDITAGNKTAKASSARFIQSKTGTPGIEIAFSFVEPSTGSYETLNWQGWLSPKAIESTMKTLVDRLGFNGNDSVNEEGILTDPKAFNYDAEVVAVVELEIYNYKTYPKIKWINSLSGSAYSNCEPQSIRAGLESVGFKAAFLAASQGKQVAASEVPF